MRFSALRPDRARRRDHDVPAQPRGHWWIARRPVYSAAVGDDAERFGAACRDRPRRSYRDAAAVDAGAAAAAGKSKDADAAPARGRNPRAGVIHDDWRGIQVRFAQRPNTDWVS